MFLHTYILKWKSGKFLETKVPKCRFIKWLACTSPHVYLLTNARADEQGLEKQLRGH